MGKMLIIIPDTENGENGELWGKWDGGNGEWENGKLKMGKWGKWGIMLKMGKTRIESREFE